MLQTQIKFSILQMSHLLCCCCCWQAFACGPEGSRRHGRDALRCSPTEIISGKSGCSCAHPQLVGFTSSPCRFSRSVPFLSLPVPSFLLPFLPSLVSVCHWFISLCLLVVRVLASLFLLVYSPVLAAYFHCLIIEIDLRGVFAMSAI